MDVNYEIERLDHVLSTVRDCLEVLPKTLESVKGVDYCAHLRPIVTSHYMIEKAVEDLRDIAEELLNLEILARAAAEEKAGEAI